MYSTLEIFYGRFAIKHSMFDSWVASAITSKNVWVDSLQIWIDLRVFSASLTCFSTSICEEKTFLTIPSSSMT
jgi:hypothetical protein